MTLYYMANDIHAPVRYSRPGYDHDLQFIGASRNMAIYSPATSPATI